MPLPKPRKGETREAFITRCMASEAAKEFPTDKDGKNQRLAVCETQYDEKDKQKEKSALALVPQSFNGQFIVNELVTRAADGANADALPPGCCAKMTGVALVYNVVDDYGTLFKPGCLAKTIVEKVRPGRVRLFSDHIPTTKTHVGTVTDIKDVGDTAVMTAVIFDAEAGRCMKEYLEAVTQSGKVTGAVTGLSVGFRSHDDESSTYEDDERQAQWCMAFLEIELREISVTPVNAVPGTDVLAVRRERGEADLGLLTRMLARILAAMRRARRGLSSRQRTRRPPTRRTAQRTRPEQHRRPTPPRTAPAVRRAHPRQQSSSQCRRASRSAGRFCATRWAPPPLASAANAALNLRTLVP